MRLEIVLQPSDGIFLIFEKLQIGHLFVAHGSVEHETTPQERNVILQQAIEISRVALHWLVEHTRGWCHSDQRVDLCLGCCLNFGKSLLPQSRRQLTQRHAAY